MSEGETRAVASAARAALARDRAAVAVALKVPAWDGPDSISLEDGRIAKVLNSNSVLGIRDRLARATEQDRLVILTSVTEEELGDDVLYRLAGRRIRSVGIWEPLLEAFAARGLDPRLRRQRDLAEALIGLMPSQGYAKAPNGLLTMDHAWSELARRLFNGRPGGSAGLILTASEPAAAANLQALSSKLIGPLIDRLLSEYGAASGPIIRSAHSGHAKVLVPLGLVAEITYGSEDASAVLAEARGALRDDWGGPIEMHEGKAAAAAARSAFDAADQGSRAAWLAKADELVAAVALQEEVWRSSVLPSGFEQRVRKAVDLIAAADDHAGLERGRTAVGLVRRHRVASERGATLGRLEMALRLQAFTLSPDLEPVSLAEAADLQMLDGGWVDFARDSVRSGATDPGLEGLLRRVDARQLARSRRFAKLLASATAADSLTGVIGVENAITERLMPLGQAHQFALIVLDGLSEGAFRSLLGSLEDRGWTEIGPAGEARPAMLATLPSITMFSRASLLSGMLASGQQREERDGFDRALSDLGDARLFHKADLASNMAGIEAEIASDRQAIGIVINAIDDMLDKGDQVSIDWSIDAIDPLGRLLAACQEAGRAIVIAGDHGHVLEHGSELRPHGGGGARWRPVDGALAADEIEIAGRRVLAPDGRAILAADETIRYGKKSAGYHGGATPQEIVTPLAVLAPGGVEIAGWAPCSRAEPAWWFLEEVLASPRPASTESPASEGEVRDRPRLFDEPAPEATPRPEWIDRLLASDQFAHPYEKAVHPPAKDRVAEFLQAIASRDNRASEAAIAGELGISSARVKGVVASLRSLLNVEGYQVLKYDQSSGDIELDRSLLDKQFSL